MIRALVVALVLLAPARTALPPVDPDCLDACKGDDDGLPSACPFLCGE